MSKARALISMSAINVVSTIIISVIETGMSTDFDGVVSFDGGGIFELADFLGALFNSVVKIMTFNTSIVPPLFSLIFWFINIFIVILLIK